MISDEIIRIALENSYQGAEIDINEFENLFQSVNKTINHGKYFDKYGIIYDKDYKFLFNNDGALSALFPQGFINEIINFLESLEYKPNINSIF